MKLTNLLLVLALLFTASCSSSKKDSSEAEGTEITDSLDGESDFIVDGDDEELILEDGDMALAENDSIALDDMEEVADAGSTVEASGPVSTNSPVIGEDGTYTAKNGETLMMISFKVYGDYRRWKEIASYNSIGQNDVRSGMQIRYQKPSSEFSWNPEGLPYLIKRGDTLATISDDKYGTVKKWRMIYENNQPLIRDPNLIYAGFTLYYVPKRDIASE